MAFGGGATTEHATELGNLTGGIEEDDVGFGTATLNLLADHIVRGGVGGNRREVGDAQDLMVARDATHLLADGMRGLAADVGVDFIEDQDGHLVLGRQDGLERKHDAGELATRRDGAQRARGFTRIGSEQELALVEAGRSRGGWRIMADCRTERGFESSLLEPEGGQFLLDRLGKLRSDPATFRGKDSGGLRHLHVDRRDVRLDPGELGVAAFQGFEFLPGAFPEGDHLLDAGPVLASEGLDEVEAFLELGKAFGIEFDVAGVAAEILMEIAEEGSRLLVLVGKGLGAGIESGELMQGPSDAAQAGEKRVVVVAQTGRGALGEFEETGRVGGALVFGGERFLLTGLEPGIADLVDLEAEEVELSGVGLFVDHEGSLLGGQGCPATMQLGECLPLGSEAAEGIEDQELPGGMEQGLVFVRSMEIDKEGTQEPESREGRRRTIDELPIGAAGRERTLQHQRTRIARIQAVVGQDAVDRFAERTDVEDRLDRTEIRARPDGTAVRAFAEDQLDGPQDHRFASPGLASDGVEPGLEFQGEVGHQGEVPDSQRGQHGASARTMARTRTGSKQGHDHALTPNLTNPF